MKKSIVRVLALVLMLTLVITSSAAALKLQKTILVMLPNCCNFALHLNF